MLRLCYGLRYGHGVRSRTVPATQRRFAPSQQFPLEQSRSIRPTGIVLAILSTFLAVPILMTGGAEGSGEILAASVAVPESSTASTSVAESTSSSLFDGSQSSDLFQAGANVAVPFGHSIEPEPSARRGIERRPGTPAALPASPSTTLIAAPTTFESDVPEPTTVAKPATSAPASTSPVTASAPTTSPATTAVPPTEPAPVTEPPVPEPTTTTAPEVTTPPPTEVSGHPTPEQWAQLRQCEASGSYTIVNPSGKYHGAYQFGVATWDGLAASIGRTDLVGVLPSQASPADQDALALELWNRRGSSPWPHCGRYLSAS
jgi:hypothetical protein